MVTINFKGEEREIDGGIFHASKLYEMFSTIPTEEIFLNIEEGVDIHIKREDYIFLSGGENLIEKSSSRLPDNPILKNHLNVKINGNTHAFNQAKVLCEDIAKHDKGIPNCEVYIELENSSDFHFDKNINLIIKGGISFITIPKSDDGIIDIEECVKIHRRPPKRQKKYRIRIDGQKYITDFSHLTGKEILEIAGLEWQRYELQRKFNDGKREIIEYNEDIDFSTFGVERFETIPKEVQQGEEKISALTKNDIEYLNYRFNGYWEEKTEETRHLIIKNYPLPVGYNIDKVELMIIIPSGYPMAALDMFYLYPEVHKKNKQEIPAICHMGYFAKNWQRWSRHYSWKPGIHTLSTHIEVVENILKKESSQ